MKIGFFLGTFDPIHLSHLYCLDTVLDKNLVDEVYVVPTVQNPWKPNPPVASFEERIYLIKRSIESINKKYPDRCKVSDIEASLSAPYYSCNTLSSLYDKYDGTTNELFIIGGADIINDITKWYNYETHIKGKFSFIGFTRSNIEITNTEVKYTLVKNELPHISSTMIRDMLSKCECAEPYVSSSISDDCEHIYCKLQ